MKAAPHYLLLTETGYEQEQPLRPTTDDGVQSVEMGRWSFVLEQLGGSDRIEVSDLEPNVIGERLQLLAVVRGLEAIEQPSTVTLVTSSRYVGRGIDRNMTNWRTNGFRWSRSGTLRPIKNRDLWMRIDQAMQFHQIECRTWQFDSARTAMANSLPQTEAKTEAGAKIRIDQPDPVETSIKPKRPHFLRSRPQNQDSPAGSTSNDALSEPRVIDHQNRGRFRLAGPRTNAFAEDCLAERIFVERMNQRIGVDHARETVNVNVNMAVTERNRFDGLLAACGVAG